MTQISWSRLLRMRKYVDRTLKRLKPIFDDQVHIGADEEFRRIALIRGARHADVAYLPACDVARVVEPKRSSHRRRDRSRTAQRGPQSNRILVGDYKEYGRARADQPERREAQRRNL